jgi:benzoate-CoA ligase
MMRNLLNLEGATRADFAGVRISTSSGEHLPGQLYEQWYERFGVEVVNFLSSTELGGVACLANDPGEQVPGSVGRPRPGVEARLVDMATGEVVDDVGVLQVRTEGAGLSYWEDFARSTETFLGGWVRHADLFRRDEHGNYWFAGRHDDFVKVGGLFVSPSEIEACLDAHPDVAENAVLAIEDADGLTTTCAYVVVRAPRQPGAEFGRELQSFAKDRLGGHRFPREVVFIDELPKTPQGKVHRRALRALDPATRR